MFWDPASQRYAMVYTGYTGMAQGGIAAATEASVGLAFSTDLFNWTKGGRILTKSGTGADAAGCTGPVVVVEKDIYHLFYVGLTASGYEGGTPTLMLATATSLTGPWTRVGTMIAPSGIGWRDRAVFRVCIVKRDSIYYAFFNASGTAEAIGYATSTSLAGPWVTDDMNSPVLGRGSVGHWDDGWIGDPSVWRAGAVWFMAYYGAKSDASAACDGLAFTNDADFPLGWTKHGVNPILVPGDPGSFDGKFAHKPAVFLTPDRHWHYYTADNGTRRTIGLATAPRSSLERLSICVGPA